MQSVDEVEEVFFDTTESLVGEVDLVSSNLEYDIWLREPQSVKERRESFLSRIGFEGSSLVDESEVMELERFTESSGDVSSCESSNGSMDEKALSERRESNSEANCSVDHSDQDWLDDISIEGQRELYNILGSGEQVHARLSEIPSKDKKKKKIVRWWRNLKRMMKKNQGSKVFKEHVMTRLRMVQNRKKCVECSAIYTGQEINAHDGLIRTMKFSPDGKYIASGGEDGVVCVWRVSSLDGFCKGEKCSFGSHEKLSHAKIIVPEKIFHIEEELVLKFLGHSSDILDLAWSSSNHLLSSSMDKTVRLWHVGSDKCLGIFRHSSCVTCVQFNPVNENYFITGSIDGKVRIWGVPKKRVEDWVNVRDVVTAVCYQPNGKGFVVGSAVGTCRFYESSGDELLLNADINIQGRKKSTGNSITGIQFLKGDAQRMMITSEDSKIRILDGLEVVRKYKGLTKSGAQMSASFTSSGNHIISVGEDSRVYVWNHDDLSIKTSKHTKSIRSSEHFFSQGVSVVLPWSDFATGPNSATCSSVSPMHDHQEALSSALDSERFSLANWFFMDGSSRATMTWPEEKLPLSVDQDCQPCADFGDHLHQNQLHHKNDSQCSSGVLPTTWGLVFVTGNCDGTIRTFHNYGLPVKV